MARAAGVATFLTIALILVRPLLTTDVRATVALTEDGRKHVAPLCGEELPSVWAKLDLDDLTDDFVPVVTNCGGVPKQTLRLRKSDIAGLTSGP